MKMKLPSLEGTIITIKFDQEAAKKYYENSLKTKRGICLITSLPQRGEGLARVEMARERQLELAGEVLEKEIGGKKFKLGKFLGQETQDQIAEVITRHLNAFAWSASKCLASTLISCAITSRWIQRSSRYARGGGNSIMKDAWSSSKRLKRC